MNNRIPQVLIGNSFNILGLSSSATLKEIRQRAQQLLQLAKIEEIREFETDIGHVSEFRTESEVKLALERISGIKERLSEIFFWFDDHSIENQKVISLISQGNYKEAIDILERINKTNIDWLGHKNLALAYLFEAFSSSNLDSFCHSLEIWKRLAESEGFWKFYEKHYLFYDELGTSPLLLQEFRGLICEFLSDITASYYHQTKEPEAVGAYYSVFGQIEKSIDDEIIQPIVLRIKKKIESLEKIISVQDCDANLIQKFLDKIHEHFLEFDKFKLLDYSSLAVLKNDSAEKLRSFSIDIYNQNDSAELALLVLDQSAKLAVSDAIASEIESDIKHIKENKAWKTISMKFDKIKELITERKIEEAKTEYLNLDDELATQHDESSNGVRVNLLIGFCLQLIKKGHELFDKKMFGIGILAIDGCLNRQNHKDAIQVFDDALVALKDRVYLLSFINSSDQTELLETIDSVSNLLKNCELNSLIDSHEASLDRIDAISNKQLNENTQTAIQLLGLAVCYSILYRRIRGVMRSKMWEWIFWGIIALCFLGAIFSKSLTQEEKGAIEYLQKYEPEFLKKARKDGYSDKQIAKYLIDGKGEK